MNYLPSRCLVGVGATALVALLLVVALVLSGATAEVDSAASWATEGWRDGPAGAAFQAATLLGYSGGLLPVAAAAALLMAIHRRWWQVVLPLLVLIGADAAKLILKAAFMRTRPMPEPSLGPFAFWDQYAFPSGHATDSMAIYGLLCCWALVSQLPGRIAVALLLALMPLAIGFSRVVLGVHWLSDVVGGWLVGLVVMSLVALGWQWVAERVEARQARRG